MKIRVGLVLALAVALGTFNGTAQDKPSASLSIRADRMERLADHVFKASGNVDAAVNGWRLRADSLEVRGDPADKVDGQPVEITAQGNVVLERGQERLLLRRLQFEPRSGRGTFELQQP